MFRRPLIAALAATAAATIVPATLLAQSQPSIVAPTTTTTTTPPLVIVAPPTTTTTTTPTLGTPSTSTTTTPVIATPSTTTTAPPIATPTSTTTSPALATPTSPTTTSPALATPSTTTTTAPDEHGPDAPIGEIDTSGTVPDGLDLTAFPDAPAAPAGPGGGGDGPTFTAEASCSTQCIESGVAYPRGFGALLVVETTVDARLWMAVVEDLESDGGDDGLTYANSTISNGRVTEFSWALDDLEPGQTYYVTVTATDEDDHTAYAYGEFTTLSQRAVDVAIGPPGVSGGPTNVVDTAVWLRVADLSYDRVSPPETIGDYLSLPRHLDLAVLVFRTWATSQYTLCEGYGVGSLSPQGDSDDACGTWNTAFDDVDLDRVPQGKSRWTEVSIQRTLQTTGSCDGDPRCFDFAVVVNLTVEYS